jgi:hypothetical protein
MNLEQMGFVTVGVWLSVNSRCGDHYNKVHYGDCAIYSEDKGYTYVILFIKKDD